MRWVQFIRVFSWTQHCAVQRCANLFVWHILPMSVFGRRRRRFSLSRFSFFIAIHTDGMYENEIKSRFSGSNKRSRLFVNVLRWLQTTMREAREREEKGRCEESCEQLANFWLVHNTQSRKVPTYYYFTYVHVHVILANVVWTRANGEIRKEKAIFHFSFRIFTSLVCRVGSMESHRAPIT